MKHQLLVSTRVRAFLTKFRSLSIMTFIFNSLITLGLLWLLSGCASSEKVRIPISDSTPPTVSMTVVVEFASGSPSQTIILNENSTAPAVVNLHRFDDAVSVVAMGTDRDGGVKNIEIVAVISTGYINSNGDGVSITPTVAPIGHPSNAQIGDDTSVQRSVTYVYEIPDPRTILPPGSSNFRVDGEIYAQATNFHNGSIRTPVFKFVYP